MKKMLFVLFLSAAALAGCKKDPVYTTTNNNTNNTGTDHVDIVNMQFDPMTITILKGASVQWKNKDNISHTVTADDNSFDSGNLAAGAVFSHTFNTIGTFSYHCNYHSSMKAKVIVQ